MKNTLITIACGVCPFLLLSSNYRAIFEGKVQDWLNSPLKAVAAYFLLPFASLYMAFLAYEKGCLLNWGIVTAFGSVVVFAFGIASFQTASGVIGIGLCILEIALAVFLAYLNLRRNTQRAGRGYAAVSYILQIAFPYLLCIVAGICLFTMMGIIGMKPTSDPFNDPW
ncbi:MAG: hypothetical protein RR867_08165 [Ruthenibacterium sp.]